MRRSGWSILLQALVKAVQHRARHVGRMSDFAENGLGWTIYEYAS